MGHAAGRRPAQARLSGLRLLTRRALLKGVTLPQPGEGRECSVPAALAAATGADYDWLLGCSGAAFDFAIDEQGWDPLAATPRDVEAMAPAAGVRLDHVAPPFDEDMRALVVERVFESLDAKLAPLVRGIGGPPEMGLVIGCAEEGPRFDCRTLFDKGKDPTRVGWEAFTDEDHGALFFIDRATAPDRAALARRSLSTAVEAAGRALPALAAWAAALRDDARWTDRQHAGAAAFGDHAMRTLLVDRREAAARFLRGVRVLLATPGGEVLRAAESYGYAAESARKAGVGPFDGSVALRFLDPGRRRGWANALDTIIGHETEARDALVAAREKVR